MPTGDRVHDQGIAQRWSLNLESPLILPMDRLVDMARGVQDLVTIAVGKNAFFEQVTLQHPNVLGQSLAGTLMGDPRDDLEFHARWTPRSERCEPDVSHHMYFTLDELGGIDAVRRWLVAAQDYRTELARVMATRYSGSMFLEDRINERQCCSGVI